MMTPNELRGRLDEALARHHEESCWQVLAILRDVLPELVALSSGRSHEDAGHRYRDDAEEN